MKSKENEKATYSMNEDGTISEIVPNDVHGVPGKDNVKTVLIPREDTVSIVRDTYDDLKDSIEIKINDMNSMINFYNSANNIITKSLIIKTDNIKEEYNNYAQEVAHTLSNLSCKVSDNSANIETIISPDGAINKINNDIEYLLNKVSFLNKIAILLGIISFLLIIAIIFIVV